MVVAALAILMGEDLQKLREKGVTEVLSKAHVSPGQLEQRVLGQLRPVLRSTEDGDAEANPDSR